MSHATSHLAEKLETLNPQQAARVDEFVDFPVTRRQERTGAHAAAASEPVFGLIWNNPEDDAYDAI